MLYIKHIHRMSCCKQYICKPCVSDYGAKHGFKLTALDADQSVRLPLQTACPCCSAPTSADVRLERVDSSEQPRSYDDSPRTKASMPAISDSILSPMKIGETFEAMKRKMLTFEAAGYRQSRLSNKREADGAPASAEKAAVARSPLAISPASPLAARHAAAPVTPAAVSASPASGAARRDSGTPASAARSGSSALTPSTWSGGRIAPVQSSAVPLEAGVPE
jgi:hypothetical protein